MVDDTRLELAVACRFAPASAAFPRGLRRALRASHEVTSSSRAFSHKKRPATLSELQICGGRYKTRTCDLPHVKRMRYQLRQSSSSLQARGILHDTAPNVKNFFLNPPFFFTATQKSSFRHKKKQSLFITGSVFLELNTALRLAVDRQHFFNAKGLYRQLAAATFSQTRNDTLLRILARRQLDH